MAGSLSRAGAVKEGIVAGTAVVAIMREGTGATLTARELVEGETDKGLLAWFSAGVLVGAILGWVVPAGAHRTMRLSKTGESHCPKFKINKLLFYPRVG